VVSSVSYQDQNWHTVALKTFHVLGYCLVEGVLTETELQEGRESVARVYERADKALQENETWRNGAYSEQHLPMLFEPHFLKYLDRESTLKILDKVLGINAIVRFQTVERQFGTSPFVPQHNFHKNLRIPYKNTPALDISYLFEPLDGKATTLEVIPGSHREDAIVSQGTQEVLSVSLQCPAGTMLVMEPRVIHRLQPPTDGTRLMHTHTQFVPHYLKQFFDYPRALGEAYGQGLSERQRQLLGWNSRIPASLDEYYRPLDQRLYKAGQW
jgi:ectoine hydroxylase-related dioxygenase (phytanoyl-CoA dioxygenase family)